MTKDNTIEHLHVSKVGGTHCLECNQQLHCSKGHEFDERNTHYRKHKDGIKIYRMCRTCSRIRAARYYARKIKLTAEKGKAWVNHF